MKYSLILKTPVGVDVDTLSEEIQAIILDQLDAKWPAGMMPGTHEVNGEQIIHVRLTIDSEDPLAQLSMLIGAYSLPWVVMHLQTMLPQPQGEDAEGNPLPDKCNVLYHDTALLNFVNRRPQEDENGTVIADPDPDMSWLHKYVSHGDWEVA